MTKKPKVAPEDMPLCSSCAFFKIEPKDTVGYCRRYPPTVIAIEDEITVVLPATERDEWCGEYVRLTS